MILTDMKEKTAVPWSISIMYVDGHVLSVFVISVDISLAVFHVSMLSGTYATTV